MKTLYSDVDESINVIYQLPAGKFEARWVHRPGADYALIYLSCHAGCSQSCRMCHLTATGQTSDVYASLETYVEQARLVLLAVTRFPSNIKRIDFAFMAQGDPLMNPTVLFVWPELRRVLDSLVLLSWRLNLDPPLYKISTIYPKDFRCSLENIFPVGEDRVVLYYSLYSMDPDFRKRWLPKAANPAEALCELGRWQYLTGNEVVIHGPFIKDENDSLASVNDMMLAIRMAGLRTRFNIVRYNPPTDKSEETGGDQLDEIRSLIQQSMPCRLVDRVGLDVYASCGTFTGSNVHS
jgi:23S rRNA (adenine2503-C2)-methyltransferase